jgi:site-specific recombinase XerC
MQAQGVKPTVVRWYVIRAEHYIRSVAHQRLEDHTPQDVTMYLEKLGRRGSMTDWQYRQAVEAIQQVLLIAEVAWAQQFDWSYWQASARTLSATHPTIAREVTPTPPTATTTSTQTQSERSVIRRDPQVAWRQALIAEIRRRGYSIRTEQAYVPWVNRFLTFCDHADPRDVGVTEVLAFLQHLAVTHQVAANTQNQARHALAFLYQYVLQQPLDNLDELVRAKRPQRLPVVLTRVEVTSLLAAMQGTHGLMAALLYGTGMRLMECMRLRVKDILPITRLSYAMARGKRTASCRCHSAQSKRCSTISNRSSAYTRKICSRDMVPCFCPTRWHGSIRRHRRHGPGSMSFPAPDCQSIRAVV